MRLKFASRKQIVYQTYNPPVQLVAARRFMIEGKRHVDTRRS
jgi:hypothetical protein